jgi:uncharacterized protein (TIGR02147 family)
MQRPMISQYDSPAEFVKDMIRFRKETEAGFSVFQSVKRLRKISPALVSLVIQGKRSLTLDRAEEFSKLLNLNVSEKIYFRKWVGQLEDKDFIESGASSVVNHQGSRKEVGLGLLSDWINVYVKDFFNLPAVQKDPTLIEKQMMTVVPAKRINKAVQFLLREGYLRKTLDGQVVLDTNLSTSEPQVPSLKIRQFHKGALSLAKIALDLFPPNERLANTLIIALDEERYEELNALIQEFAEKLKDFAAKNPDKPGNRLYQLIINLSPVGGKLE